LNLGAGDAPPAGTKDDGYGAEARWNLSDSEVVARPQLSFCISWCMTATKTKTVVIAARAA